MTLNQIELSRAVNRTEERTKKEVDLFKKKVRTLIADYMATEGCSCCQNITGHKKNTAKLGKLLGVQKYSDGSGYDFHKYRSKRK